MRTILAFTLAVTLTAGAQPKPADLPAGYWPLAKSEEVLKKTETIRLAPDLSSLTAAEKSALKDLLEVGDIFQKLYEEQRHHQARHGLDRLQVLDVQLGQPKATQNLLQLYRLNQGPIASTRRGRSSKRSSPPTRTCATRSSASARSSAAPRARMSIGICRSSTRSPSCARCIQRSSSSCAT